MGRLSPIADDAKKGLDAGLWDSQFKDVACVCCGEEVTSGGFWAGDYTVIYCPFCWEKAIHIAIDAFLDAPTHRAAIAQDPNNIIALHREFMLKVDAIFWQKHSMEMTALAKKQAQTIRRATIFIPPDDDCSE